MSFYGEERTLKDKTFKKSGARLIQNKIATSIKKGKRQCVITGNLEIENTVLIPSDFTLVLSDCHLRLKDGVFCNMFKNASCGEDFDHNIKIIGQGRAILDGGNYNGLSEKNSNKDGNPHISVNHLILFIKVEDFVVSNLEFRNQRYWAINLVYSRYGRVKNIDFHADDTLLYPDGSRKHGTFRKTLAEVSGSSVYLHNADGIDLRVGCHDILIEDIYGMVGDDSVAITGLQDSYYKKYGTDELSSDIYNIIVRNIRTETIHTGVRMLNQSGIKLYNVLVDGVMDISKGSKHTDQAYYTVRIGDSHLYGTRHSTKEETYNIVIRNVYGRAKSIINLEGEITNVTIENIHGFDEFGERGEILNNAKLYGDSKVESVKKI